MRDVRREEKVATLWALVTAAAFAGLAALGCSEADGQPSPPRGAPRAPTLAMDVQEATDTTAVLRAAWSQVSPPADTWRYRHAGDTAQVDSTALAVEVPRLDSTHAETVCVWGVAVRGSDEREGPETCGSVDVPPRPLEAPGSIDSLDVTLDTAQVAQLPEMPSDVQVAEVSRTDTTVTYEATWTCAAGAEQYIVRAGSNDGTRTYLRDTLSAGDCIAGETVTRQLAMRLPRDDMLQRCRQTGACITR